MINPPRLLLAHGRGVRERVAVVVAVAVSVKGDAGEGFPTGEKVWVEVLFPFSRTPSARPRCAHNVKSFFTQTPPGSTRAAEGGREEQLAAVSSGGAADCSKVSLLT